MLSARFRRTAAVLLLLLISASAGRGQSQGDGEHCAGTLLVLDAATKRPIPNCAFRFHDWRPATTDGDGIYLCTSAGFEGRLQARVPLLFWHPSYERTRVDDYRVDPDGGVTVLLKKGGTASLTVDTAALGPEPGAKDQYRVRVVVKGRPIRQTLLLSPETSYRFSGLAGGQHIVQVDRWDGTLCWRYLCRHVFLDEGQHSHVAAASLRCYSRGRHVTPIPCAGLVLDERTGKPLGNVYVRLTPGRSSRPPLMTGPDGRFWTMIDKGDLDRSRGRAPSPHGEIRVWPYNIDEEAAEKLVFHLPLRDGLSLKTTGDLPLRYFDPKAGVCCNGRDCLVCGTAAKGREANQGRQMGDGIPEKRTDAY